MSSNEEDIAASALIRLQKGDVQFATESNAVGEAQKLNQEDDSCSSKDTTPNASMPRKKPTDALDEPKRIDPKEQKRKYRKKKTEPRHQYPVQPEIISLVFKPKTFVNHSYSDYSRVPPETGYQLPRSIDEMTFSQRLHQILSNEEYSELITWMPHGRAFQILAPKRLEEEALPKYFGHSRYSRLLTQLKANSFKTISSGVDKGCYYHECFLKGLAHLCKYMPVHEVPSRRLLPDPDNEPDFYEISRRYPVEGLLLGIAQGSYDATRPEANVLPQRAHVTQGLGVPPLLQQHLGGVAPPIAGLIGPLLGQNTATSSLSLLQELKRNHDFTSSVQQLMVHTQQPTLSALDSALAYTASPSGGPAAFSPAQHLMDREILMHATVAEVAEERMRRLTALTVLDRSIVAQSAVATVAPLQPSPAADASVARLPVSPPPNTVADSSLLLFHQLLQQQERMKRGDNQP